MSMMRNRRIRRRQRQRQRKKNDIDATMLTRGMILDGVDEIGVPYVPVVLTELHLVQRLLIHRHLDRK